MSETRAKNTWSPSRRTLVKGAAWTAPVVAVGVAAPAFAASPSDCTPVLTFSPDSCKCPGQSVGTEEFVYYLKFCVTVAQGCPGGNGAGTFIIDSVEKSNGTLLDETPNTCFPATLATQTPTTVGNCTANTYRFTGVNSGNWLEVNFTVTVNGVATSYSTKVASPPKCADINLSDRCLPCVA